MFNLLFLLDRLSIVYKVDFQLKPDCYHTENEHYIFYPFDCASNLNNLQTVFVTDFRLYYDSSKNVCLELLSYYDPQHILDKFS